MKEWKRGVGKVVRSIYAGEGKGEHRYAMSFLGRLFPPTSVD